MEQDVQDEPRAANDNRKRLPVDPGKVNTVKTAENKPGLRQRWRKSNLPRRSLSGPVWPALF